MKVTTKMMIPKMKMITKMKMIPKKMIPKMKMTTKMNMIPMMMIPKMKMITKMKIIPNMMITKIMITKMKITKDDDDNKDDLINPPAAPVNKAKAASRSRRLLILPNPSSLFTLVLCRLSRRF